MTHNYSIHYVL